MIVTAYNYTIHKNFAKLQGIKNTRYCNQKFQYFSNKFNNDIFKSTINVKLYYIHKYYTILNDETAYAIT